MVTIPIDSIEDNEITIDSMALISGLEAMVSVIRKYEEEANS